MAPRLRSSRDKQITIRDVAREAQVSIATVSRVINRSDYVSPEIEQRVREAVARIGYYPDSVARSLKNNSTLTIGFLVSDISNKYFMLMARAIEEVVNAKSYHIILGSTDGDKEREIEYVRTLLSKRVDGLILDTTGHNYDFLASMSRKIPMVVVHRRIKSELFRGDFVGANNLQGAYDLTKYVISRLHRHIAVVNGPLFVSTGEDRYEGYLRAMRESGIEPRPEYRFDGDYLEHSGYEAAAALMSLDEPPTAIVIMNNEMTVGALKYLRSREIPVPKDVSIATYGSIVNGELMYVSPTHATQDPNAIATRAAELMLERIANPDLANREVIFQPSVVESNSVAGPK